MRLKQNKKGISTVVAVSIILAVIVTVAAAFQAFVVPQLDRENAFAHSQGILNSFEQLYSAGSSTIQLSYSGTPFFSASYFPGQLSCTPTVNLNVNIFGATTASESETLLSQNSSINVQGVSSATLYLKGATGGIQATATFTNNTEQATFQINTQQLKINNQTTIITVELDVTVNSQPPASYNYSTLIGDSLGLPLLSPLYGLSNVLTQSSQVHYTTNSPSCMLYLDYEAISTANLSYTANGALLYQTNSFPLAYMATPWGVTAIQDGTSAISNSKINWAAGTLTLDLYNITGFSGVLSGSGSAGITFVQTKLTSLNATFSQLTLNFTSTDSTLNQSINQIFNVLKSYAPSETTVTFEQGQTWAEITIKGNDALTLLLHNVNISTS